MTDLVAGLQAGFVDRILAEAYWGDTTLKDPAWSAAFDAAPRHLFAPDTWYEWTGVGWNTRRRADDEDAWAHAVYAVDKPLITQVDPDTGRPSCSLSAPHLVAAMLGALQLKPGMRVFESGTGSGWTAALMSMVADTGVGSGVDSVEYDPRLAHQAALNADRVLLQAGRSGRAPNIFPGDGEAGGGWRGPYDVTTATHAVWRIPKPWIDQTRPGGLLCAPVAVSETGLDLFVRLTVHGDGSASGPVLFPLAFMRSRSEPRPPAAEWAGDEARESATDLNLPAILADEQVSVLRLAIPGLTITGPAVEDGDDCVWLSTPDGSWAVGYVPQGTPWEGAVVEQHGPADVWSLAEAAWARWESAGQPGLDEYGLTVTARNEHRLWCKSPDMVVATF